jgi:hypothetical protein
MPAIILGYADRAHRVLANNAFGVTAPTMNICSLIQTDWRHRAKIANDLAPHTEPGNGIDGLWRLDLGLVKKCARNRRLLFSASRKAIGGQSTPEFLGGPGHPAKAPPASG